MLLLLASTLLSAPSTSAALVASPDAVVVVARRINQADANLKACLARHCAPNEDIDGSLALAESQILAGKYREARSTLLASLGRNKDAARKYPIPVSDLYRANGRVAAHLGFDNDYYSSTWGIYRTLKQGLRSDTYRHYSALMEIAEMMGDTRGHARARLYYESIARQARSDGRADIAAIAELRSALRHLPAGSERDSIVRRTAASRDPNMRGAALEAKLALARMAYERGDQADAHALQKDFAALDIKRPILIYAPSFEAIDKAASNGSEFANPLRGKQYGAIMHVNMLPYAQWSTTNRIPPNFDDMWIDVSFRIDSDGNVVDLEIPRSRGDQYWTDPLLQSIKGRKYTPGRDGDPGSHRLERYTYTAAYQKLTGTHAMGRSPDGRVEYFDLSPMGIAAAD